MRILKPFEEVSKNTSTLIILGWACLLMGIWGIYSIQDTHLFPSIPQVISGFSELWKAGLMTHIGSSLMLCGQSVLIAIVISLVLVYTSPIPLLNPISTFLSKFRYLPLTGIAFYITMLVSDGRAVQVWILVVFMSTYLTTSLLGSLKDIPVEEIDHARTLGCSRWEVLMEVVIKGRMDYVIENVRQNLAIVWMMLVTVESILASAGGLGFLIKNSDKFMNHGRIIALQLIILLVGLLLDLFLNSIRKLLFRYSKF